MGVNKMRKTILIFTLIGILGFVSACTDVKSGITNGKSSINNVGKNSNENKIENGSKDKQLREKNKKIEVKVEGQTEFCDAKLMYSDDKKYSLYVLNNFTFSAEEPNKDIIFSNFDGEFFVRIEELDGNVDISQLKKTFTNSYSGNSNVTEREPTTVFADKFKDSKLWLHVDILKPDKVNVQTSINYLVKEYNGKIYSFTFHFPLKEAAEGVTPSLWAMVSTMEVE
jgi:hypothetical protein